MSLPASVAERVAEALAAMRRHPARALLPWYRYAIYAALAEGDARRGAAARARLEIAAARRALFCWPPYARAAWPGGGAQPERLLVLAERLLDGVVSGAAYAQLDRARALADVAGEPESSPHYCAWCVFEAAVRAAESAGSAAGATRGVSSCADDASGYAAIAIGGGEWRPVAGAAGRWDWQTEDARLRREVFWEWWLREGLPAAWRDCRL